MRFFGLNGGAEGDRTPDLRIANAALSQLSYCPNYCNFNNLAELLMVLGDSCRNIVPSCLTSVQRDATALSTTLGLPRNAEARTLAINIANDALSQLSYVPTRNLLLAVLPAAKSSLRRDNLPSLPLSTRGR